VPSNSARKTSQFARGGFCVELSQVAVFFLPALPSCVALWRHDGRALPGNHSRSLSATAQQGQGGAFDISAHDSNPLCGDEIDVTAKLVDHKIVELKFDGKGCAICTASASIMTQKLVGKTLPEAGQLIDGFLNMMRGETPFGGKEMGDLKALEGVLKFPVRVKCATLAWNTARQAFKNVRRRNPDTDTALAHTATRPCPINLRNTSRLEKRGLYFPNSAAFSGRTPPARCRQKTDAELGHELKRSGAEVGGEKVSGLLMDMLQLNAQLRRIHELGVQIKDFDRGLSISPHPRGPRGAPLLGARRRRHRVLARHRYGLQRPRTPVAPAMPLRARR